MKLVRRAGAAGPALPRLDDARATKELDRRRAYIEGYSFPGALRETVSSAYDPPLTGSQAAVVFEGLRDWFVACLLAEGRTLGMPSQAVDDAWHEYILMTRDYHTFCADAFGYYLHHVPHAAMAEPLHEALARTMVVLERNSIGTSPERGAKGVPFLFAVDAELGIEGFHWTREDVDSLRRGDSAGSGGSCGASCSATCGGGSCGGGA